MANFVHLRVHSEYSLVDGLPGIKPLFKRVHELGMPAVAVTDETNFFAAVKIYKAAMASGVKPIFGADIWVQDGENKSRLCLLCQNNSGYHNLTVLLSEAYKSAERQNGIPLIPKDWLTAEAMAGLIALSCGLQGDIGQAINLGHVEQVRERLAFWLQVFSAERFYLELQRIGHPGETTYIEKVLELAEQAEVAVVATNPVCFLQLDDFMAHEVRVAIHDGYIIDDPNRPKNYTEQQYLLSQEQMLELFSDIPAALANSVEIAKRCNVSMELDKPRLPNFPVPEGMTVDEFLCSEAEKGLAERLELIQPEDPKSYHERLKIELDVIISMGFPGYFLIVADFIHWSKNNDVPVGPGRGSGAGSLVAYALKITDVDPLPYDLLFERFLNPERVSMPDFDVDFCMDGRDRVIDYVAEKYGRESVSQIITYGSMAAKAVIRDVGRVLGHPYGFVDAIAKLIPLELGMTLTKALEGEEVLKARYDTDEEVKALVDMGLKLEGTVRNVGKHAGGVVISPSLLTDFCPTYCEENSKSLVTQFDKDDVEAAGLVKFDFLGLRNLTIINSAIKIVNAIKRKNNEAEIDINLIPLNDKFSFDLLKRCETTAVFQLESRGMKDLIRRLQPDCFEEIIALVALFRPGPLQSGMVDDFINRKHGRAKVEYPHPLTKDILEPTYGIILYQEQVMLLAQVLAGYTLGGADMLRRAMGKKKPEEMAKQREIFTKGAVKNGIKEETATYIFDLMEKFAGYGFNKSHSAAYALVAYQTAWLKAHYPAAFMAAVLSSDMDNTDKVVAFVEDCNDLKLKLLAPDINSSFYKFTVQDEKTIRYGLGAVKGVGEAAIEMACAERKENGVFKDLFDFCRRIEVRKLNKRALEALTYAGALDALGPSRESVFASIGKALQVADQHSRDQQSGQVDLFAMVPEVAEQNQPEFEPGPQNPSKKLRLLHEKSVLGFYLSGHPIEENIAELQRMKVKPLSEVLKTTQKVTIHVAGVVINTRRLKTKRGNLMQILTLDDATGRAEVTVFSDTLEQYKNLIQLNETLVIQAEASQDAYTGGVRLNAKEFYTVEAARAKFSKALHLKVTIDQANQGVLPELKKLFQQYSGGSCPVVVTYKSRKASASMRLAEDWRLRTTDECLEKLHQLLSKQHVVVGY